MVDSLIIVLENGNLEQLRENIDMWLASAEIDSIPGAKKRILATHKAYAQDKCISRNWDKFYEKIGNALRRKGKYDEFAHLLNRRSQKTNKISSHV